MILFAVALLLDALLLWLVIGARGRWPVKAACIVLVLFFNFSIYRLADNGTGWATSDPPPVHSIYVSCQVDEPTSIYMWLVPLGGTGVLDYHPPAAEPRAYKLPYSDRLYALCIQAAKLAGKGITVPITRGRGEGKQTGNAHGHGRGHGQGAGRGTGHAQTTSSAGGSASPGQDKNYMKLGNIASANRLPTKS